MENENQTAISFPNGSIVTTQTLSAITNPTYCFDDNVLNAAFTITNLNLRYESQQIALLRCDEAQLVHSARDANVYGDPEWYRQDAWIPLIEKLAGKTYVIIPINDGLLPDHHRVMSTHDSLDKEEDTGKGKHWSLVVANCDGNVLQARHYDSCSTGAKPITHNRIVAEETMHGLRHLLEAEYQGGHRKAVNFRTYYGYEFTTYVETQFRVATDDENMSACGIFVWALGKWFAERLSINGPIRLAMRKFEHKKEYFDAQIFRAAYVRKCIFDNIETEIKLMMDTFGTADYELIFQNIQSILAAERRPAADAPSHKQVELEYLGKRNEMNDRAVDS